MPAASPLINLIEDRFLLLCARLMGQPDSGEIAAASILLGALGSIPSEADVNALVAVLDSQDPYPEFELGRNKHSLEEGGFMCTPCMDAVDTYLTSLGHKDTSLEFRSWLCLMLSSSKDS